MANSKEIALLYSLISTSLTSLTVLLQILSTFIKHLKDQERILSLGYQEALLNRNEALERYQRIKQRLARKRSCWVKPGRTDAWWVNLSNNKMCSEEWKINFRMSEKDFYDLVEMIRPFSKRNNSHNLPVRSDIISLEKRVAITLYYLKDLGSLSVTANAFGCHKSTVSVIIHEICDIIAKEIGPKFINFPKTKDEVYKAANDFEKRFGFPQVIGCIDGTHIPIKQPSENAHDYYSYKMFYSINCQAICNSSGQFIDVEIKWPGSVHDARVFANSSVQKNILNGNYPLFYKDLLPGYDCVPQLFLGDPAYPLLPYVMKEFGSCKSNEEVIFNQMLRSARNQIECAFGRLKARWRMLQRPLDVDIKHIPNVIYTCFVLHNYCEIRNAEISQDQVNVALAGEKASFNIQTSQINQIYSYNTTMGGNVRNTITSYFKEFL